MFNKNFILLRGSRASSKRVVAKRRPETSLSAEQWPIEITVAGQTICTTDAGAREMIEQLQKAVRS